MAGAIVALPKGPYFDLADIFTVWTEQINRHQRMITLKVTAIPPALAAESAVAWEIGEYLQEVQRTLFAETRPSEQEPGLSLTWLFEDYSSRWLQIVPHSQVADYVDQLVALLAKIPRLYPDLFGLVWEPISCWQEDRERGLTQTNSWMEELERKYGL
ncbi:MAG: hypothetical protein ACE5OZ_01190 [Candidatus Heimdallarchaeota archaeon]